MGNELFCGYTDKLLEDSHAVYLTTKNAINRFFSNTYDLLGHRFLFSFIAPGMCLLLGKGLKPNQKAVGYSDNIYATNATMDISCQAGPY